MTPAETGLSSLSSASYSVLSQLLASPNPFPAPAEHSAQFKLRQARQLNKHLRSTLEYTLNLTAARRADQDKDKGKRVGDQNAPPDADEDKLKRRIDKLRKEAEVLRGSKLVYERLNAR